MARKNKKPKNSRPEIIDDAYEAELIGQKEELEEQIRAYVLRSAKEVSDISLWAMIGAGAIAFDMVLLCGAGTALTLGYGALFTRSKLRIRQAEKKLKQVKQDLKEYQDMKQRLSPPPVAEQKPLNSSLKDDFKPAAAPETEVEQLRKKLSELEKKMEELQRPKPAKLDKNNLQKPEDKPGH